MRSPPSIGDYAVIGDCRSAALVSKEGSIDWLCWPRFDSPSIFGELLGAGAGRFRLAPAGRFRAKRRYLPGTNVLETTFTTSTGRLRVVDFMPVCSEEDKKSLLLPDHELARVAECQAGQVAVELLFEPAPDYGRREVRLAAMGRLGLRAETGEGLLALRTEIPLRLEGSAARGALVLSAGQKARCSLTFSAHWPGVFSPLGEWTDASLERSARWWRDWSGELRYEGPFREAVVRSALALRLLFYAPSGAVIAAPTTSLPEVLGGGLNWDYRYCWLRDASMTARALFGLGCRDEAEAFVNWLLHTTRLSGVDLRILYDVYGAPPGAERELGHLPGHRASRPVRVGNAAAGQLQLDVFGEVIDAASHFALEGGELDSDMRRMLCRFGRRVCESWRRPDEGIWEPRSGRRRHTYSALLCWTALDRLLTLKEKGFMDLDCVADAARERDAIRREIEVQGWNKDLQSYTGEFGGSELDASVLLMSWYGFAPASSHRMKRTYARIVRELGAGGGLLRRYRTRVSPGEGAFGICGFWAAEFLALGGGSAAQAREVLGELISYGNDVGLFAEELDPATKAALGNFPQGFTHVGLINAALSLERRLKGEPPHTEAAARARTAA